jgi:hypothetical protein
MNMNPPEEVISVWKAEYSGQHDAVFAEGVIGTPARAHLSHEDADQKSGVLRTEFRWEVFNVLNHPLFAAPGGDISTGAAAQITALSGDPRVMQFALRVDF